MTALKMDLSWLKRRLPGYDKALIAKQESMNETLETAIGSVERIVSGLRPGPLEDLGLVAALEWLIDDFQRRTGIRCKLEERVGEIALDAERAVVVYRILQESLTNIVKHAQATEVAVALFEEGGQLVLIVNDNGMGIKREEAFDSQSFGIMGMRERAGFFGGEVKIGRKRGKGTRVEVRIPIERSEK